MSNRNGHRWTSKPPRATALDMGHPLAASIDFALALNEGGGAPNDSSANRARGTTVGTVSWAAGRDGWAISNGASSSTTFGAAGNYTTQSFSALAWINQTSLTNSVLLYKGAFSTAGWYVQLNNSTGDVAIHLNNSLGTSFVETNPGACTAGVWQMIGFSYNGTSANMWLNGVDATKGGGTVRVPDSSSDPLRLGDYGSGGFAFPGKIGGVYLFKGVALTQPQVMSFYEEFWQVYQAPPARRFYAVPGAPSSVHGRRTLYPRAGSRGTN